MLVIGERYGCEGCGVFFVCVVRFEVKNVMDEEIVWGGLGE